MSALYLLPTASRLASRFRIYGVDLPGFGASAGPRQPLAVGELAETLAAFLQDNELGPAHLLANSLGCQIAVAVAARYPESANQLVLIGPTVDCQHRTAREQLSRLALDVFRERPSLLALAAYDYLRAGPRRTWRTMFHALEDPIEQRLGAVPHPALVVRGSRDPLVTQQWAETVADLLPNGRLAVIDGAAHATNYSTAEAVASVILPFLEGTAF